MPRLRRLAYNLKLLTLATKLAFSNDAFAQSRVVLPKENEDYTGPLGNNIAPTANTFADGISHPAPLRPWTLGHATVPKFVVLPPAEISVSEGETISLVANVAPRPLHYSDAFVSWIVDGKLACVSQRCELGFGPSFIRAGEHTLAVMAYSPFGSVTSLHKLRVTAAGINPAPSTIVSARPVASIRANLQAPNVDRTKPNAYASKGASIYSNREDPMVIGFMPRNIPWQGFMRPNGTTHLHVFIPGQSELFFSDAHVQLKSEGTNAGDKVVRLEKGYVRVNNTVLGRLGGKAPEYAYEVKVETNEGQVKVPVDSEVLILKGTHIIPQDEVDVSKKVQQKTGTRIVVVTGSAEVLVRTFNARQPWQKVALPAGSELIVFSDATATPIHKPDTREVEKLMTLSLSVRQLEERIATQAEGKRGKAEEKLDEVERLLGEDMSYDALVSLEEIDKQISAKDPRILYLRGVALKRIFFVTEAEKMFQAATKIDNKFAKAYWQLAELRADVANWRAASVYLSKLGELVTTGHELYPRYLYLSAVVKFKLGENFSALNEFKRALWQQELPDALRSSSGQFLDAIAKRKPLSFVAISGVQYDGNVLGISSQAPLPDAYTKRATLKSLVGGVLSYERQPKVDQSAWFWGGGLQSFYVKNLDTQFSALDAIIVEASLSQTRRPQKLANASTSLFHNDFKISETVSVIFLDKKMVTQSGIMTLSLGRHKLGFGVERTLTEGTSNAAPGALLVQETGFELAITDALKIDNPLKFEEHLPRKKTETDVPTYALTYSPSVTLPFAQTISLQVGLNLYGSQKNKSPSELTLRAGPTTTASYFVTPWLVCGLNLAYEYSRISSNDSTTNASKPTAGLMLTGLF